ncbi:UNVERIFIED_CONTAM: hypothetical protein GTU68_048733 [Idotea baltica]|nr:hypothetical protein [Idotea baltica]
MSNMAVHLRKLVGTAHPLLKTAKRLVYNGRNNMQTRGLIILLLSKAAGQKNPELMDQDLPDGVSHNQRSLAEITEMIHTAHLIHKGVVNLSPSIYPDGTTLNDMTFGNKIAILSGDYLLANACTGLAALNNSQVVEMVSSAISDFMEAEFIGLHDLHDNALPNANFGIKDWENKNFLAAGSLLAKSCQGTMLLAGHDEEKQRKAFEFGKCIALAWQVHSELQPFVDLPRHPPGTPFDLTSAPVVLQIENAKDEASTKMILDIVEHSPSAASIETADFNMLFHIMTSGTAIQDAKDLCNRYTQAALSTLAEFEPGDARDALENIVHALKEE